MRGLILKSDELLQGIYEGDLISIVVGTIFIIFIDLTAATAVIL